MADLDNGERTPSAGERLIAQMCESIGYSDGSDGDESGVEELIDYKNALEDRLVQAVDEAPARGGDPLSVLPDDVKALIAATFSRDPDTIEADVKTWDEVRRIFPADQAPEPGQDGMTRIPQLPRGVRRRTMKPFGFCGQGQPTTVTECGKCGAKLRTAEEAEANRG